MCICNEGWTALGDLSTKPGAGCSLHVQTIRIMGGMSIIFSFTLFSVCLRYFYQRPSNWKSPKVRWSDPIMLFPFCFTVVGIFSTLTNILKVIDPIKFSVGNDAIFTTLFFVTSASAFSGMVFYVDLLLRFLINQAKVMSVEARERTQKICERTKKGLVFLHFIGITISAIPFEILLRPQDSEAASGALFISFG